MYEQHVLINECPYDTVYSFLHSTQFVRSVYLGSVFRQVFFSVLFRLEGKQPVIVDNFSVKYFNLRLFAVLCHLFDGVVRALDLLNATLLEQLARVLGAFVVDVCVWGTSEAVTQARHVREEKHVISVRSAPC